MEEKHHYSSVYDYHYDGPSAYSCRKGMEKNVDVAGASSLCASPRIKEIELAAKKKPKVLVSPYFSHNHNYGSDVEVEIAASPFFQKESSEKRRIEETKVAAKKKRKVLISPYFSHNHNYGSDVEVEIAASPFFQKESFEKRRFEETEVAAKKKRKVVISPYFSHNHNYGSDVEIEIAASPFFQKKSSKNGSFEKKIREDKNVSEKSFGQDKKGKGKRKLREDKNVSKKSISEVKKGKEKGKPKGKGKENPKVKFNPFLEAYRRKIHDNYWIPPKSCYELLQERYYEDPWKVLIICLLLNKTTGCQARRVIFDLFKLCPDAKAATKVETEEIENIIRSLGLQKKRSSTIQQFSQEYLSNKWTHVTQLHGIGKYAADAYAIFCTGRWKDIEPDDHKLVPYWKFLWESELITF